VHRVGRRRRHLGRPVVDPERPLGGPGQLDALLERLGVPAGQGVGQGDQGLPELGGRVCVVLEEALRDLAGPGGRDGDVGVLVDVGHVGHLLDPVGLVVLDDAERVDPEVWDPELLRDPDGVLDGLGQVGDEEIFLSVGQAGRGGLELLRAAPAVAQRCVPDLALLLGAAVRVAKLDSVAARDVDKARRNLVRLWRRGRSARVTVRLVAGPDPLPDLFEALGGGRISPGRTAADVFGCGIS